VKFQKCLILWYIMLREKHVLNAFQNRVLCKTFGSESDEVAGDGENCMLLRRMSF
jgi:hypothetical protein